MAQKSNTDGKTDSEVKRPITQDQSGGDKRPRRRILGVALAGLVLVGLLAGIPYYRYAISHESTDDAFIDGTILPISPRVAGHVARVYVTDNQKVAAGDLLVEIDPRDFQARLDAAEAKLQAAESASRTRDIELKLTSTTAKAGLEYAKATVAAARAMVQNAQALAAAAKSQKNEAYAQASFAKAALAQAKAEIMAVEASYQQASLDLKRYQEMAKSHTISPQQLNHALTTQRMAAAQLKASKSKIATQQAMVQRAQAALKSAEDHVRQAQAQVIARQAQIEQAIARLASARPVPVRVAQSSSRAEESRADVKKAQAEVEQARLNLSYTLIHAPAAGYVTKKSVDPGNFVQVGQSLMAIVPPQVWVTANFKETQLTHIRPGQPVTISVDTYPDAIFHGHVDSIQQGTGSRFSLLPPENATGNFVKVVQRIPVKILFDRPEEFAKYRLVPGMSVEPTVDIQAKGTPPVVRKTAARPA